MPFSLWLLLIDSRRATLTEPDTLWHYTDAGGLLGVLGSNPEPRDPNIEGPQSCRPSFRATAVEYLNDSRELIHGLGILKEQVLIPRADELSAINYRPDEPHLVANPKEKADFLRALCETIEKVEQRTYGNHIHCYVTSFSEHNDVLSQWRAYCGGLDGFAIGIDASMLPDTPEAKVKQVLYDDDPASWKTVTDYVHRWVDRRLRDTEAPEASPGMFDHCIRQLSRYATQFKHNGFREEAEWRVIHLGMSGGASYRNRGAKLIPYVTWSLPADAVVAVRVGPGPNQHENYLAAQGALHAFGYTTAAKNLTISPTPYR
ncbi:DUF2971 domain-containing protein [Rhodococcus rhodochrous]|uniref:DUF2971 domain-containing protein n=1 Tax=Rhodococcus rhodochrous TaxID=1829 RepID=UPI00167BA996|nr:DUF2971 domain-containing protein [Rhodococcus rhodochrous]